ncbi:MAG: hypothetical protein HY055_04250 [Magnetospirillum sp.]|nr:hypothetical protein [Magnetospirillum sp.]
MSQALIVIPTTGVLSGLALAQAINAANAAISSLLAGPSAPTAAGLGLASLAGLPWHDTASGTLKVRDQADGAWITIGTFDETAKTFRPAGLATVATTGAYADLSGKPSLGTASAKNTGTSGNVVALLDGANTYSAPQTAGTQALTDAATVTIAITAQVWTLTTTAARTMGAPTGGTAGTAYLLVLNTGGFTPSWNTAFDWGTAGPPSGLTGICTFDIYYDGSKYRISTRSVGGA